MIADVGEGIIVAREEPPVPGRRVAKEVCVADSRSCGLRAFSPSGAVEAGRDNSDYYLAFYRPCQNGT